MNTPNATGGPNPATQVPTPDLTPAQARLAADPAFHAAQEEAARSQLGRQLAQMAAPAAQREQWRLHLGVQAWMRELAEPSPTDATRPAPARPDVNQPAHRTAPRGGGAGAGDDPPGPETSEWLWAGDEVYGPGQYVTWADGAGKVVRVVIRGELVFDAASEGVA